MKWLTKNTIILWNFIYPHLSIKIILQQGSGSKIIPEEGIRFQITVSDLFSFNYMSKKRGMHIQRGSNGM